MNTNFNLITEISIQYFPNLVNTKGEKIKYNLPIVDFYKITKEHEDTITDGVHLNQEGYKYLAEELVKKVREYIS